VVVVTVVSSEVDGLVSGSTSSSRSVQTALTMAVSGDSRSPSSPSGKGAREYVTSNGSLM